jgi:hypothetical protein
MCKIRIFPAYWTTLSLSSKHLYCRKRKGPERFQVTPARPGFVTDPAFSLGIDTTSRKVRSGYTQRQITARGIYPRRESNSRPSLTRGLLYPLSYWGISFILQKIQIGKTQNRAYSAGGPIIKQPRIFSAPFIHGFIVDEWETTNLLRANSERLAAPQVLADYFPLPCTIETARPLGSRQATQNVP